MCNICNNYWDEKDLELMKMEINLRKHRIETGQEESTEHFGRVMSAYLHLRFGLIKQEVDDTIHIKQAIKLAKQSIS